MSAALSGVQGHRQPQAPSAERTKPDGSSEVGRAETCRTICVSASVQDHLRFCTPDFAAAIRFRPFS